MKLEERDGKNQLEIGLLIGWFAVCMAAASLGVGVAVYCVALIIGTWQAAVRPSRVMWIVIWQLATSVITVPYDYVSHWGGDAPDPYWYWGAAISLPAFATFVALVLGTRPHKYGNHAKAIATALKGFLAVILLAIAYGYAQGNGVGIILRQGTGLFFLFFFILLVRRLALTTSQLLEMLRKVRNVLIGYGAVYVGYHVYLNLRFIQQLPEEVFLRESTPPLFFCGLFAALSVGEWLFWRKSVELRGFWIGTSVLAFAAVLSGSRASVACMLVTIAFFVILKYVAHPVRFCLVIATAVLVFALFKPQEALSSIAQKSPFVEHVVGRLLQSPENDPSLQERSSQMISIWEIFGSRPLLGQGIGASFVWFDPASTSWVETAFVDNGFGYLLLKTGSLGTIAFFWLLAVLFRSIWRWWNLTSDPLLLGILGTLVYYTVYLFFEPGFFEFLYCFWIAALIGYVLAIGANSRFSAKRANSCAIHESRPTAAGLAQQPT